MTAASGSSRERRAKLSLKDAEIFRLLPTRLFVEPTLTCNVGCTFCKYSPVNSSEDSGVDDFRIPERAIESIIVYSTTWPLEELVITGGGEPTYEMSILGRLIEEVSAASVTLYTAGQWADTPLHALEMLDSLEEMADLAKRPLRVRLSVDTFHARTLGHDILNNVLRAESIRRAHATSTLISYGIRSLIGQESYIRRLVSGSGGKFTAASPGSGTSEFAINDEVLRVPVLFKGIVPLGRMKANNANRMHILTPVQLRELYAKELGSGWPVTFEGGWNAGVRWSGDVYLYGGSPVEYGDLRAGDSLLGAFERMAEDPLNYLAAKMGFDVLYELMYEAGFLDRKLVEVLHDPSLYLPVGLSDANRRAQAQEKAFKYIARHVPSELSQSVDSSVNTARPRPPGAVSSVEQVRDLLVGAQTGAHGVRVALGGYTGRSHMQDITTSGDEAGQDQRIGSIRGSRNVKISQTIQAGGPAVQEVGDISDAEDIDIRQQINAIMRLAGEIDPAQVECLDQDELRLAMGSLLTRTLSTNQIETAAQLARSMEPNGLVAAIGALATSSAVVSGVLTIGALTNPIAMAIAAPVALVLAHVVDPEPVLHFLSWLRRRLRHA